MTALPQGHYVIAGAGGMMGSHALLRLANQPGVTVTALYNVRPPQVSAPNIVPVQADLTRREDCARAMPAADYLLLYAGLLAPAPVLARDPVGSVVVNELIVSQALEAAYNAGIGKVVWLSSTTGYPELDRPIVETDMFTADPPDVWYMLGWTTRYGEALCRAYSDKLPRRMPCIVLRPSIIYGEYDHFDDQAGHFLPALLRRVVHREKPIEVWGSGEHRRDLIHAADVVEASLRALSMVDGFATYNIPAGISYSVNEVLARLIALDGYDDAEIRHVEGRPGTIRDRVFDGAKARNEIGFVPAITLDAGLRRTINWYRSRFFS